MKIAGAKILVTGASSGIGAALAPILAERGATVGIVARREERLREVLAQCREHTPDSQMWAADLGDLDARRAGRARGVGRVRRARRARATTPRSRSARTSPISRPPMSRYVMDVDFHSPVRMSLAVLPRMIDRGRGHDRVRVEHGRPHPDRERVRVQRGEVRDVRLGAKRCTSTSRGTGRRHQADPARARSPPRSGTSPTTSPR